MIMKEIKLLVTLEVPDDYTIDEPEWTLKEAINSSSDVEIISVRECGENVEKI